LAALTLKLERKMEEEKASSRQQISASQGTISQLNSEIEALMRERDSVSGDVQSL
jgi:hypothetical protein